jgi:3-oxoacyl-[acyl-carrier-protein] synthase-3
MLMNTDSEALLVAGIALAKETWHKFEKELGWSADSVERVITHQVGTAHRRALLDAVGIDTAKDHPTVELLGNIGSVSLPITYALARETGFAKTEHATALLGIGSGLNCSMLAVGP